ncbi:hypothetical protein [Kitasatospora paranensis]|jgi:hypothetical protein|uniref:Uncharacterized protein n=1 Tax=Kitasatospora paranensis TaxID=258053 RepID=A0ABW2FU77_9ACTN
MYRGLTRTAVLLALAGAACLPGIATAQAAGQTRTIVIGDQNQVAGSDIFNAGGDNTVGSNDGTNAGTGRLDVSAIAAAVAKHYLG